MSEESTPGFLDAVRLLCNAIQKVDYYDHHNEAEGISPLCKNHGELMLQDALFYLALGDTHNARAVMETYDDWRMTGDAPWPYDSSKPSPGFRPCFDEIIEEDPGGGVRLKDDDDLDDEIPF